MQSYTERLSTVMKYLIGGKKITLGISKNEKNDQN